MSEVYKDPETGEIYIGCSLRALLKEQLVKGWQWVKPYALLVLSICFFVGCVGIGLGVL